VHITFVRYPTPTYLPTYLLTRFSLGDPDLAPLLPQIPYCVGRALQMIDAIMASCIS
jgi:hypothetical protein